MDGSGHGRLPFLGIRLARRFEIRIVTVAPGHERAFDDDDWRDALVSVERGQIELESSSGASWRFARGDLLWLSGLPLRALHNPGREPAVLVAVSRRGAIRRGPRPAGPSAL
jgi:quercetin dioxygenase-like cupin family protein